MALEGAIKGYSSSYGFVAIRLITFTTTSSKLNVVIKLFGNLFVSA